MAAVPLSSADKPLPSLPPPASPTLTNPDMLLPDHDAASLSSPHKSARPPSPSYLLDRRQRDRRANARDSQQDTAHVVYAKQHSRQHSWGTHTPEKGLEQGAVLQASPARRAQYRYSDVALASSPTVSYAAVPSSQAERLVDEHRRLSATPSSIDSEDLDSMQIPGFVEDDDDTDTLADGELDVATPSERWHAGEQIEPPETEESAVTLMRAEMILANAKKRLNMMDQNLRGAREIVAPLTAANLKRATSLTSAFAHPPYYGRPNHLGSAPQRQRLDRQSSADALGHHRVLSDPSISATLPERPYTSLSRAAIPVNKFAPSWTSNPLRGSRSQGELNGSSQRMARPSREPLASPLETLQENDAPAARTMSPRPSTTTNLKEQMDELKGRISMIKERAREDSMRRKSMQSLRQPCPLLSPAPSTPPFTATQNPQALRKTLGAAFSPIHVPETPSPPLTEDGELVFDPELGYAALSPRTYAMKMAPFQHFGKDTAPSLTESSVVSNSPTGTVTNMSEHSAASTNYEDSSDRPSTQQRHEDRDDAFDYSNFFLHSAMGTFSRPRGESIASTESGETARGPSTFDQVPPTPQTPETLREIERNMHSRTMSCESVATTASFATAQEGIKSGRATPMAMADWLAPRSKDGRSTALSTDRADSAAGHVNNAKASRSSSRISSSRMSHQPFPSIPPSATSIAVSALIDPNGRRLGLKDKALVFTVVDSLSQICEQLQTEDEKGSTIYLLRQRLEDAKKILDGTTTRLAL